tara:strand:+ start:110 stop:862 length:753 start_codon:yes stop_codon:yes gene_type:complete
MEHFLSYNDNTDNYSQKITLNKYTQGESEGKINQHILKSDNILEIILSEKDCNYQLLEKSEKSNYITKKSLELSTHIEQHYNKYNYNKRKFNKNLISNSLQSKNNLASILFYNDYFNINIVICNKIHDLVKLFKTGLKNAEYMFIMYNENHFNSIDIDNIDIIGDLENNLSKIYETMGHVDNPHYTLENVIKFDIKPETIIYNLYLKPITTYKLDELVNYAKEFDISLMKSNGKKKVKKELYDDINLSKF